MQYNLPTRITGEADLKYYEKYLIDDTNNKTTIESPTTEDFLKNIKGQTVIIELLNCRKTGVITEIGKDYIILSRFNNNTFIPFNSIKSIILPQGNQTLRHQKNFLP